jgi:hypothetical protein
MIRYAAVITVVFIACSSFPDQVPPEERKDANATSPPTSAQLPPPSIPKGGSTSSSNDASAPTETSPPATNDAGVPDAAPAGDASAKDSTAPAPKLGFGQPCSSHAQCADGLCLPFDGKGLRCTKTCQDDDDCPSDDCDGDDVKICDVD